MFTFLDDNLWSNNSADPRNQQQQVPQQMPPPPQMNPQQQMYAQQQPMYAPQQQVPYADHAMAEVNNMRAALEAAHQQIEDERRAHAQHMQMNVPQRTPARVYAQPSEPKKSSSGFDALTMVILALLAVIVVLLVQFSSRLKQLGLMVAQLHGVPL